MIKGGLLVNLEEKIRYSQEMINDLERELKWNQTQVIHLQYAWNQSLKKPYSKDLLDERQEILDRLIENNNCIDSCKLRIDKFKKLYKFFYDCYYFVDKANY